MHYCGNTLVSVSVDSKAKSCCGDDTGTCCHNETKRFQVKDSYIAAFQDINDQIACVSDLLALVSNSSNINHNNNTVDGILFITEYPTSKTLQTTLSTLQTYLL